MGTLPTTPNSVVDILSALISLPSVNPMGQDVDGPIYFEGRVSDWLVKYFDSFGDCRGS